MITWSDVTAIARDLTDVPVATQTAILADVEAQLSETNLGTRYDLACKYLAAHLGALYKRGANGAAGAVASEQVGGVSRSYASAPLTDPSYDSTTYGREFKRIIRQLKFRLGTVL